MKKLLILFAAMSISFAAASAQEAGRWQVELGLSYSAIDRVGYGYTLTSEIIDARSSFSSGTGIQATYAPTVFPTLMLLAGYDIPGTVLGVYLGTYWNYAYNQMNGGPSPLIEREHIFHFVPQLHVYYATTDMLRFYGSVGLGLRYRHFTETFNGSTVGNRDYDVSVEVSPFGVTAGENWIFSFNFGVGMPWSIARISAGYRF